MLMCLSVWSEVQIVCVWSSCGARRPPLSIDISSPHGAQQQTRRALLPRSNDGTYGQGRPQDSGQGGQCPLAARGEENWENVATKWCILKYI